MGQRITEGGEGPGIHAVIYLYKVDSQTRCCSSTLNEGRILGNFFFIKGSEKSMT